MSIQDFSAMAGATAVIVSLATGYLKVFVSKSLGDMEKRILADVDAKYVRTDLSLQRYADHERRIAKLEAQRE